MILAALSAAPVMTEAQKAPAPPAGWNDVRSFFAQSVKDEGVVGAGLALIHRDTVLAHDSWGDADRNPRRAVDANTIWHWASITKTFTGIAIMQLRDRGKLSLDDPIVKYVPELRAVHDSFGPIENITIRQLMSHSAGFRNPTWIWGGDQPWHPFEPTEWSQLVAMFPYTEILFKPGSKYSYSNPGVIFLGQVIERLSGDDIEVYIDKNILKPLGMTHSYFDLTPYHLLKYRSNSWATDAGKTTPLGLDFDTGITTANGGLNSPITDMVKYLAFLSGGAASRDEPAVLSRKSLDEMWKSFLPVEDKDGIQERIGLSFFEWTKGGKRLVGHTGSQRGFRAFIYVEPASGYGVIGVINTAPADEDAKDAHPAVEKIWSGVRSRVFDSLLK
ncbi:MAG: serine hydrolase domain-containing protein [Gemmatimonadota bacterium]